MFYKGATITASIIKNPMLLIGNYKKYLSVINRELTKMRLWGYAIAAIINLQIYLSMGINNFNEGSKI